MRQPSSVDAASEKWDLETLENLKGKYTTILDCASAVYDQNADRILVLDQGKLQKQGHMKNC